MGNKQDVIRNHDTTVMQAGFSLGTLCCQMLPSVLHLILYPFMRSKDALQCAAVYTCT